MIVEQIWTANAGRNFNYLIACAETGEALAVDPLDHQKCLAAAKAKGWTITQILNTHEHHDHTGGNAQVIAATGAKLLAHAGAKDRIAGIDRGLKRRRCDQGRQDGRARMPRHAGPHDVAYLHPRAHRHARPVLRRHLVQCRRRQLPQWRSSERALQHALPASSQNCRKTTLIYPGHDYIARNLAFTLDREPDNADAKGDAAGGRKAGHDKAAGHDARRSSGRSTRSSG